LEEIRFRFPQKHGGDNQWYKIVIMDVEVDHLGTFIADLKETIHAKELRSKYKALKVTF
jgi:hypothetical protein